MMRSMTGFASVTHDDERGSVSVTLRAVNHRFLDLQLRLPPLVAEAEPRVRALVQRGLARGRVELQVSGERYVLDEGDVVTFRGDQRHSYHNPGKEPAVAYSVIAFAPVTS